MTLSKLLDVISLVLVMLCLLAFIAIPAPQDTGICDVELAPLLCFDVWKYLR